MPDGGKKLPGTYLSDKDLRALPGLVEHTPEAKYMFSAGQAQSRFLQGLREGRILGVRCPRCGRVYVPPRSYCEYCFAPRASGSRLVVRARSTRLLLATSQLSGRGWRSRR
ncbi:Zn-ribbon domain-containing OB-fold protein [Aeropyrum camini]|uniref:Zn-ribbon domain-containing OB-fold protein n=1 Tax=Aeropyrum camini TaxID=229980 RepID=UPI000AED7AAC|nr:zinc ribbon domain-containing protein [Aeropyrum camini]